MTTFLKHFLGKGKKRKAEEVEKYEEAAPNVKEEAETSKEAVEDGDSDSDDSDDEE